MSTLSLRYGGGSFDVRSTFLKIWGSLQGKKVVLLNSDPKVCAKILSSSDVKGTFIEHFFAVAAWNPVYSIESVDGKLWENLARDCRKVMGDLDWRNRLSPLIAKNVSLLEKQSKRDSGFVISSETISRLVLRIMFELLFDSSISIEDETVFYQASLEFRKQIGIKGEANSTVKEHFWIRLDQLVRGSRFGKELQKYPNDPGQWLSVFAQPFLISPQINIADIMEATFRLLRDEPDRLVLARKWAKSGDSSRIFGVAMEAVRLQHPFPILERELQHDIKVGQKKYLAGTQVFILLDRFIQDHTFDPERWLQSSANNPYHSMPFGAGHRMCIGKPIAINLIVDLLLALLTRFPEEQLRPSQFHHYSGRNNDHTQSWKETAYQAKLFGTTLWKSWVLSRKREKTSQGCPFSLNADSKSHLISSQNSRRRIVQRNQLQ